MKVQIPFSVYCVHDCDMSEQFDPTHPNKATKIKTESDWFKQPDTYMYPWASDLPAMR